jgi:hypothetical protein
LITCSGPVGINNSTLENQIELYPNPTTGMITVRVNSQAEVELTVTDMLGKEIRKQLISDSEKHAIDLSAMRTERISLNSALN